MRLSQSHSLSLALALSLGLAACTPVDPAPFHRFAASTATVGPALDAAFELDVQWTKAGLRERLAAGSPEEFKALGVEVDSESLQAKRDADPLFIKLQAARRAARSLNETAAQYAAFLAALAGDAAMSQDDFDGLARNLQTHSVDATQAFEKAMQNHTAGYTAPDAARSGSGVFSVAAAEAFRLWLESERRESLVEALEQTQPTVDAWAALLQSCVRLIADDLRDEYDDARRRIGKTLLRGTTDAAKQAAATELLRREMKVRDALKTLAGLDAAYGALSAAHRDLRVNLTQLNFDLAALQAYQSHTTHLQKLYRELTAE